MANKTNSWNAVLKFSWGHIIAFVALIFIAYVTFAGTFYKKGDFTEALIWGLGTPVLLGVLFIGAQILKGTDKHFQKRIKWERTLVVLSIVAYVAMIVLSNYAHFWSVISKGSTIETRFTTSIQQSKKMFDDYDNYAQQRLHNYDRLLSCLKCTSAEKANFKRTLELQLCSQNADALKTEATKWVDGASKGANVWNVFLIGNIDKIEEAIIGWNSTLVETSQHILSNEAQVAKNNKRGDIVYEQITIAPYDGQSYQAAMKGLQDLQKTYKEETETTAGCILSALLAFLGLSLPYVVQGRNTKSRVALNSNGSGNKKDAETADSVKLYDGVC